ncbi:MAG: branched-chain amino acid ABC transporter permease [candidate division WOR-3 bacterium]
MPGWRRLSSFFSLNFIIILAFLIITALLPLIWSSHGVLHILSIIYMYATMTLGWSTLAGFVGEVSFGHHVFFGLGAYTTALLWLNFRLGIPALPISGVVSLAFAVVVGLLFKRISGVVFTIATLCISEVIKSLFLNWEAVGAGIGLQLNPLPRIPMITYYYTILAAMVIEAFLAYLIRKSRYGLALFAIKNDPTAAQCLGIRVIKYKILFLLFGAFFEGVAGGFYALLVCHIEPLTAFDVMLMLNMQLIGLLGGIATIWGPIVASFLFLLAAQYVIIQFKEIQIIIWGVIMISLIKFMPNGLAGVLRRRI